MTVRNDWSYTWWSATEEITFPCPGIGSDLCQIRLAQATSSGDGAQGTVRAKRLPHACLAEASHDHLAHPSRDHRTDLLPITSTDITQPDPGAGRQGVLEVPHDDR